MAKIVFGFFLLFFLELWVIIKVGSVLGAFMVILLMVLAAGYGVSLVRSQGLRTMMTIQQQLAQGVAPTTTALEGVMLLLAGALFIFPGFLTDIMALMLLQPMIRQWLIRKLTSSSRWQIYSVHTTVEGEAQHVEPDTTEVFRDKIKPTPHAGTTVDGEYERKDQDGDKQ
ncbi:FxsA family protein [Tolumonas lignilytica]|uniref:FxsA family protein n=1 Tax=Tolumonas lignilytica TaxID=1283284 RepID=UPI0004643022|nr:FxsA family protein [Tolumonas lignilytica]